MAGPKLRNPLSGLLPDDPLADNPEARHWREQAIRYKADLEKALKADLKTRAAMRRAYERLNPLTEETVSRNLGLGLPFGLAVEVPKQRKRGRPSRKITGGILYAPPVNRRPGRKPTWSRAKRKTLLAWVEQQQAEHPEFGQRRITAKELLRTALESYIGHKPRPSEEQQFEKDLQVLQAQVSIARREQRNNKL